MCHPVVHGIVRHCVEFFYFSFITEYIMLIDVPADGSLYTTTWLLHQLHGWLSLDLQISFYRFIDLCMKSWVMFPSISRTTGSPTFIHWTIDDHHDQVRPFWTPLDPFSNTCKIQKHLIQLIPQILQHGSSHWRSLHICGPQMMMWWTWCYYHEEKKRKCFSWNQLFIQNENHLIKTCYSGIESKTVKYHFINMGK